jgi:hypothetical protein
MDPTISGPDGDNATHKCRDSINNSARNVRRRGTRLRWRFEKANVDDILTVVDTIFVPEGKKNSKWIGSDEFEKFAEKHAKNDVCFGFGDKGGMTLETPFGADSALIKFKTDQQHPQLGNGLLIATQIRSSQRFEDVCVEAAGLNFLETRTWTDFPQLGCWHPQETSENEANWAHSCFIPNALFMPGLIEILLTGQ